MSSKHEFFRLAEESGVNVEWAAGGRDPMTGATAPFSVTLDAPIGFVFASSGLHCDCSVQGREGTTRVDWPYLVAQLREVLAGGFVECTDPDCDMCGGEE